MDNPFNSNDPLWETSKHMNPDMMLVIIDMVEDWVVNEKPDIKMMDVCFLTNNFGVA
tara:strand:+ start:447 stop:617 length:171 start_codon:yes stop_codon:yes gene_type:complete